MRIGPLLRGMGVHFARQPQAVYFKYWLGPQCAVLPFVALHIPNRFPSQGSYAPSCSLSLPEACSSMDYRLWVPLSTLIAACRPMSRPNYPVTELTQINDPVPTVPPNSESAESISRTLLARSAEESERIAH